MKQGVLHCIVIVLTIVAIGTQVTTSPEKAKTRASDVSFANMTLEEQFSRIDADACIVTVRVTPRNTQKHVIREQVTIPRGETQQVTIADHELVRVHCSDRGKARFVWKSSF